MKTLIKGCLAFILLSTLTGGATGFNASVKIITFIGGPAAAMIIAGAISPRK